MQQLSRVDLSKASYDYLCKQVGILTDQVEMVVQYVTGADMLFRVRLNPPSRPSTWDDLGAPPAQFVTGFQRCNPPGVPMFYGASRRIIALKETRTKPGDVVYLSQWAPNTGYPVSSMFDSREHLRGISLSSHSEYVTTYLDALITRPIHEVFSSQYKLTSAIAQELTTNFHPDGHSGVGDDELSALIYPSIFDAERSFNMAMHSSFARERMILTHLTEMVAIIGGDEPRFRVLDNAIPTLDRGLRWLSDAAALPALIAYRDAVSFVNRDGCAAMPFVEGLVDENYLTSLLEEDTRSSLLPRSGWRTFEMQPELEIKASS